MDEVVELLPPPPRRSRPFFCGWWSPFRHCGDDNGTNRRTEDEERSRPTTTRTATDSDIAGVIPTASSGSMTVKIKTTTTTMGTRKTRNRGILAFWARPQEPSLPKLESEEPSESTWSSSSLYGDEFEDDDSNHRGVSSSSNNDNNNDEDAIVSFQVSNPTQWIWQWTQLLISFILVLHHSTNHSHIKRKKTENTFGKNNKHQLDEHCDECPPTIESNSH